MMPLLCLAIRRLYPGLVSVRGRSLTALALRAGISSVHSTPNVGGCVKADEFSSSPGNGGKAYL